MAADICGGTHFVWSEEFKKATSGVLSEEDSGQGAEAKPDAPKAENAKTENPKAETQTVKDETKTPSL